MSKLKSFAVGVVDFIAFLLNGFVVLVPFMFGVGLLALAAQLVHPNGSLVVLCLVGGYWALYIGRLMFRMEVGESSKSDEAQAIERLSKEVFELKLIVERVLWRMK